MVYGHTLRMPSQRQRPQRYSGKRSAPGVSAPLPLAPANDSHVTPLGGGRGPGHGLS